MLTPDQIRMRLARVQDRAPDLALAQLLDLLEEVLPELVALAAGRSGQTPPMAADRAR